MSGEGRTYDRYGGVSTTPNHNRGKKTGTEASTFLKEVP